MPSNINILEGIPHRYCEQDITHSKFNIFAILALSNSISGSFSLSRLYILVFPPPLQIRTEAIQSCFAICRSSR